MTVPTEALYRVPIRSRPPFTARDWAHLVAFNLVFGTCLVVIHTFQLAFLPLALVPHPTAERAFRAVNTAAKEAFASTLVLIVAVFGPSRIVITADGESVRVQDLVQKNEAGRVVALRLARQAVWMSNHQMYADWIYPWICLSFAGVSSGLIIILKASLEWAPIVGPAMQLFRFCFINNRERTLPKSNLYQVAQVAERAGEPYHALLFPEGTLYSGLTRPKSKAFAAKLGIPDANNVLLPRSAGLFFTLRTLRTIFDLSPSSSSPSSSSNLTFYDLTVGYAGVPSQGYAQDYYSLQSLFGRGVSPPEVHLHFRTHQLASVPLGAASLRAGARAQHIAESATADDKAAFERWLRARWDEKDALMGVFGARGRFEGQGVQDEREVLEVRMRAGDWLTLAGVPVALYVWWKVVRTAWGLVRVVL
ncbi:hypothetical protein Rhopal_002889-T1 [Rhodotorula paludigena]|uniref:Phospholipid/glycerol acyltransferase domain-containing protein n=1 Tax=Rhodotorula paludigena TaxID=86838 RepID=A0AAV5GBI7_9BASI|nr:hypothetical protein Rhopal_002889-T1 [Rhodotorula paludigena]